MRRIVFEFPIDQISYTFDKMQDDANFEFLYYTILYMETLSSEL